MNGVLQPKLFRRFRPPFLLKPYSDHRYGSRNRVLTSLQCGKIIQSLTNARSLLQGRKLHAHMVVSNVLRDNVYLLTKVAAFYAICGRMRDAQEVFDDIPVKNSFLWNSMIRGYVSCGLCLEGLELYVDMLSSREVGDCFTYPFVLKACGELWLVDTGRNVHCQAVVNGSQGNPFVENSLLAMYGRFGDVEMLTRVFRRMVERDLTSWNTIISWHAKNGDAEEALVACRNMLKAGFVADGVTLLGILRACSDLNLVMLGREVHGFAIRYGILCHNASVVNSLIDTYCSFNFMTEARRLFEVETADKISWNSMIYGYARNGDAIESLELFHRMVGEGVEPDEVSVIVVLGVCDQIPASNFGILVHSYIVKVGFGVSITVGTAIVDSYSKCGSLTCSRRAFDEMPLKSLFTWSSMISGYGTHGKGREAISTFNEMIGTGIVPDGGAFTSVLSACSHSGLVDEGKEIFNSMGKEFNIKPGPAHYTCLVDLLCRAGRLDEAYEIIDTAKFECDDDTWTALLSACFQHHNTELAEVSATKIISLRTARVGCYIGLSHVYAAQERWLDVERVRAAMRGQGLQKPVGRSFVEAE